MKLKAMKCSFFFILILIFLLSFFLSPSILENADQYRLFYDQVKNDFAETIFGDSITNTDAYIVNTYYYPKSKSLGDNAVAMILLMNRNTMRDITKYKMKLVASNETTSVSVIPKLLKESYAKCAYVNIVAHTKTLLNMKKLEMISGNSKFEIPFKLPRSIAPAPVIICISPQFVAEQWQIFLSHAHIARHFGGHLHLYITSILVSYFNLVKEYEKLGYVTVDFWMRMKFSNSSSDSLEPNSNVEWRNQAGALTDCLLQYKEVASFITFFDLDDILVPRGFDSYFDEFSNLYYLNPEILTFQYPKREMMIYNKENISDFDFEEQFGHSWFETEEDTGKIVARPEDLDSMWIHRSFYVPDKKLQVVHNNFLLHIQRPVDIDGQDPITYEERNFAIYNNLKLNKSILTPIQKEFKETISLPRLREIIEKLPKQSYYFPIMFRCYYFKYYRSLDNTCPNGEGCLIPQRSDYPCFHSDSDYKSGPPMYPITFHFHENPKWSTKIGCYT